VSVLIFLFPLSATGLVFRGCTLHAVAPRRQFAGTVEIICTFFYLADVNVCMLKTDKTAGGKMAKILV